MKTCAALYVVELAESSVLMVIFVYSANIDHAPVFYS